VAPEEGFVLDCSVALSWFFKDEKNAYADSVQDGLPFTAAIVPALWPLEATNSVLVGERRGRATVAQGTGWISLLQSLPIRVDAETASRAWADTLHVARAHALSSYDASYLELALRRRVSLATLDRSLRDAATVAGVPLYEPRSI
jgi:predicted nucleic acid-binding protein